MIISARCELRILIKQSAGRDRTKGHKGGAGITPAPPFVPRTTFGRPSPSTSAEDEAEDDEDDEDEEGEEEYLPDAVGALALHLAGAAVDDDLVDLVVEAVGADVDGEQEVLEGDGRVLRRDVRDALLVAADVAAHVRVDDGGGRLLRQLEALGEAHLVALRLVAGEVRGLVGGQLAQVPGLEGREPPGRQRLRRGDE